MKKIVNAYLHTHYDREWYRDKEEFNLRLVELFDEVIIELERGFAPCFYFDGQVSALIDYLKFRPENEQRIKKLIKQKKLFIGPFFVSADAFLSNLRLQIKNLEKGMKFSKEFENTDFIGYLADIFSHSRSSFELFKKFDINNAIIWRGTGAINSEFKMRDVNTTRLIEGYFIDTLHNNTDIKTCAKNLENILDKINEFSNDRLLLPLGGDHLAIIKNASEKIVEINKHLEKYEIILGSPFDYFKNLDFNNKKEYDGEFMDNSIHNILGGVYSSRVYQKIVNSKSMFELTKIVEPLNHFLNQNYGAQIEYIYELMLKNHAHDSIYGCSLDSVHRAVQNRFEKIESILLGIKKRIIRDFHKNTKKPNCVGVFNLSHGGNISTLKFTSEHKIKNSQILSKQKGFTDEKLYNTNQVPITEDITTLYEQIVEIDNIKPFSFSSKVPLVPTKKTFATNCSIENDNLKLEIIDNKIAVYDKKNNQKYDDFIKIIDTKDDGDSYNYAPAGESVDIKILKTKLIYCGDIQSKLRIYFKNIELDVILNNKSEFFQFDIKLNNKTKNHKLQLAFNLKAPIDVHFAQDAMGIIKRTCDPNYSLYQNMPARRPQELKTNSFPMLNFVIAQNFFALTKGLNEYEIYKNELRICLIRSSGIISNPKNKARSIPAGPPISTPELQCLGEHKMNISIGFESDYKKIFGYQDEFFNSQVAFLLDEKIEDKEFLKLNNNQIFYGINDKKEKILYDFIDDGLIFDK